MRNANHQHLTGGTGRIGLVAQLRFWLRRPHGIDVFVATVDGRRAGYLLLRRGDGTAYITEVVEDRFRGRGLARRMIAFAAGLHPHLTAEILSVNVASRRLHEGAGFVLTCTRDDIERYTLVR